MEVIEQTKEIIKIKVCSKCGREYDTSWDQCINCSLPLLVKGKEVEPIRTPEPGEIVCPNPFCRYVGEPNKEKKWSTFIAVLMLLCGIIPLIIYICVSQGYNYSCPKCGCMLDMEKLIGERSQNRSRP